MTLYHYYPAQKSRLHVIAAWLLLTFLAVPACATNNDATTSKTITALLASKKHSLLRHADFSAQSDELNKLYRQYSMSLIWFGDKRVEKNLTAAVTVLNHADAEGLNPLDYDADTLQQALTDYKQTTNLSLATLVAYDTALSIAMLRYVHDLHLGRVDPHSLGYPSPFGAKTGFDIASSLKASIEQENIAELPELLAPNSKQYSLLKAALAEYRQQAQESQAAPLSLANALHPGDQDPQLPELRKRLMALGLLTPEQLNGIAETDTSYDEASKNAIMHFQEAQGLNPDGFIGKQTLHLLNQTPQEKISLISLGMERLRWLPKVPKGRQIIVNIAAFQLWAFASAEDDNPLNMKVVVGKAKENQTPILWEEMKYLEFMPYWNIPRSIMDKEINPKIRSNAGFLQSQKIELIEKTSSEPDEELEDGTVISHVTHSFVRARQLPGNKNPLGKVKFIFPNQADVYLHDTPARGAFTRDRRDLSHGCVRVAAAEKLAEFVLKDQVDWDNERIQAAMSDTKTKHVSLLKSIPVMFFYSTAYAGTDNIVRFYPDVYGYDKQLQNALENPY